MKIIFMGTAAFAVPSLVKLFDAGHKIDLVITQPDKPAGRGRKMTPPPVADMAKRLGIKLYQPKSLKSRKVMDNIKSYKPDIIVVIAYGKILPKELLDMPKLGCINVHSSLLPKYRGAAPMNWAIVNGEKYTGVTTMFINEDLDAGDMLLKAEIKIEYEDNSITLHNKLAPLGAELLLKTIEGLKNKTIKPEPQNPSEASSAPLIKKEDGLINWKKDAKTIRNLVRGMQPWPSAYTHLEGKMLKIFDASVLAANITEKPGEIVAADEGIVVATGDGKICIKELQLEGKRRMKASEFLHGHKIKVGTILE